MENQFHGHAMDDNRHPVAKRILLYIPVTLPVPSVATQAAKRRHEDVDDDEDANWVVVLLNST